MRFGFLTLLTVTALVAWPVDSVSQIIDLSEPTTRNVTPRLQVGKRMASLQVKNGFELSEVATGLGKISALALNGQGMIYTADPQSGRIWQLSDRNNDGRVDTKRALPYRFDTPTGLAAHNERLYVSDQNAIWVMKGLMPPEKLAGLRQAQSLGRPHPLAISDDGKTLYLSLTTTETTAKLLSINTESGTANLIESLSTDERVQALSSLGQDTPWVLLSHSLGPSLSRITKLNSTREFKGLALPVSDTNWPVVFSQHIILSEHSADDYSVIAVPAQLGKPTEAGEKLLTGFLSSTGRSAWGAPGAMVFDKHGLIISDSFNGDLYRLSASKDTPPKAEASESVSNSKIEASEEILPKVPLTTNTGSQIKSLSTIGSASTLDIGSTIIRDYKPLSLENENAEENSKKEPDEKKPN